MMVRRKLRLTSMHDFVNFVQIGQTAHYCECDLAENRLRYRSYFLVDVVERSMGFQRVSQLRKVKEKRERTVLSHPLSMNSIHIQI